MLTYFYTLGVLFGIATAIELYILLHNKPIWYKGWRVIGNWKEGGQIVALYLYIAAFALSFPIAKFILWANFLSK